MNQEFNDTEQNEFKIALSSKNIKSKVNSVGPDTGVSSTSETITFGAGDKIQKGDFMYSNSATLRFPRRFCCCE